MCGICGIYNRGADKENEQRVLAMRERMRERGPDDAGLSRLGPVVLGHRRLAVIDLSAAGHQPMVSPDGRTAVVYNGEIYNFQDLRRDLAARGWAFQSRTDTEVLLAGYAAWGLESLLKRLAGMFAFGLYDANEDTLYLARDRLGQKPLYYAERAGEVLFASTLNALMAAASDWVVDPSALNAYLSYLYVPADACILDGVKKVPPATYVAFGRHAREPTYYWRLRFAPRSAWDARVAEQELEARLRAVVRRHLVSDVPLGSFLSGGVDSSLVTALMVEAQGTVDTFSLVVPGTDYDESVPARRVAEHLGSRHHEIEVPAPSVADLPFLVSQFGEPYADSSALPAYWIAREARRRVTVALTGDGGDEAFGGYRYVPYARRLAAWRHLLPAMVWRSLATVLEHGDGTQPEGLRGRAANLFWHLGHDLIDTYERRAYLRGGLRRAWYDGTRLAPCLKSEIHAPHRRALERFDASDDVGRVLGIDFQTLLPGDYLVKIDVACMAASLEGRSPFLDHELVEFAASLPADVLLVDGETKGLLKRVAARHLPPEVVYRQKRGFSIPVREWWRGPLRNVLEHYIENSRAAEHGLLNPDGVRRATQEHLAGRRRHENLLWAFFMFELWIRLVLDRDEQAAAISQQLREGLVR